ncbi:MAG: hypothetical protein ACUVWR_19470, partial [Anaerolineae bacterium]
MNESYAPTRWSLRDLLAAPEGPEIDGYLRQLEETVRSIEAARPRLSADMPEGEFLAILRAYETMATIANRLGGYAFLWFSEDTQNPAALNLHGRLDQVLANAQNR